MSAHTSVAMVPWNGKQAIPTKPNPVTQIKMPESKFEHETLMVPWVDDKPVLLVAAEPGAGAEVSHEMRNRVRAAQEMAPEHESGVVVWPGQTSGKFVAVGGGWWYSFDTVQWGSLPQKYTLGASDPDGTVGYHPGIFTVKSASGAILTVTGNALSWQDAGMPTTVSPGGGYSHLAQTALAGLPGMQSKHSCPNEGCGWGGEIPVFALVQHLNDHHRWTREHIADWLDELDAAGFDMSINFPDPGESEEEAA